MDKKGWARYSFAFKDLTFYSGRQTTKTYSILCDNAKNEASRMYKNSEDVCIISSAWSTIKRFASGKVVFLLSLQKKVSLQIAYRKRSKMGNSLPGQKKSVRWGTDKV